MVTELRINKKCDRILTPGPTVHTFISVAIRDGLLIVCVHSELKWTRDRLTPLLDGSAGWPTDNICSPSTGARITGLDQSAGSASVW